MMKAVFAFFFGACMCFAARPAGATGTAMIRQADGRSDVYKNVQIKLIHDALFLTSPDGRGTLVIHRAACAFQGPLLVCFPTSAVLVQAGSTNALKLSDGTLYINATGVAESLALSTAKVPPHGILLSFNTRRGTYVSLSGRFDKIVR